MEFNNEAAVREVATAFALYERALIANDLEALDEFFLASDLVVRYGFDDIQHGAHEVRAFRAGLVRQTPPRDLFDTSIVALGDEVAVVNTQFVTRASDETESQRFGRQTQVWVRIDTSWRIVSAHVSWPSTTTASTDC